MNQLMTSTSLTPFDGYGECDDEPSAGGAEYAQFDGAAQNMWHGREAGASLHLGPYYGVKCLIELLKWNGKRVVDRIQQSPGVPLPDVNTLNEAIDRTE